MATTKTDIANLAIAHLAGTPISDIDAATNQQGRLAARFFDSTLDEVLADHPWGFAKFRVELTADGDAPAFGWDYRFPLPQGNDAETPHCLRVLETDLDDTKEPWAIEGPWLVTDSSTASILYVARVTDIAQWPPLFVTTYSYCLAAKLAYPITRSLNVRRDMLNMYGSELQRARTVSGLSGPPRVIRSTTLTTDVR